MANVEGQRASRSHAAFLRSAYGKRKALLLLALATRAYAEGMAAVKTYEVAGHTFPDTVDAVCIKPKPDGSPCLRPWADLDAATRDAIGQPELPHVPNLTLNEWDEIQAEKQRRAEQRERAYAAIMDLSKR